MLTPKGFVILSQFQTFKPTSDAARFVPLLQAEFDAGRLRAAHTAEVTNSDTGVRWKVYCLPAKQG